MVPEGVHLRDCPAAGLDVYEESLHGSVRVVDRQVEVQLSKKQCCGNGTGDRRFLTSGTGTVTC